MALYYISQFIFQMIDNKERREHAPVDSVPYSPITLKEGTPITLDIPKHPVCDVWTMTLTNPHQVYIYNVAKILL